jgi:pSer/pThr/pTyr-binding forkhead associated (FHA) protein
MARRPSLDELERRLQALIEVRLVNLLPGSRTEDMVVQQLAAVVRSNTDYDRTDSQFPAAYELRVPPAEMAQWEDDQELMDELTNVIKTIAGESGFALSVSPSLQMRGDPSLRAGEIQIHVVQPESSIATTQGVPHGEPAAAPESPIPQNAFLIIGGVKVHPLDRSVVNIGRRSDNHVVLDDPRISRYHAQLRAIRGRYVVFDLNSTGGTFVNGQRTTQCVLYPGDVLSLSGVSIIFGQDNPPPGTRRTGTEPLTHPSPHDRPTAVFKRPTQEESKD